MGIGTAANFKFALEIQLGVMSLNSPHFDCVQAGMLSKKDASIDNRKKLFITLRVTKIAKRLNFQEKGKNVPVPQAFEVWNELY